MSIFNTPACDTKVTVSIYTSNGKTHVFELGRWYASETADLMRFGFWEGNDYYPAHTILRVNLKAGHKRKAVVRGNSQSGNDQKTGGDRK